MRSTLHKQSFPPVKIAVFQSLYTHNIIHIQQSAYLELGMPVREE